MQSTKFQNIVAITAIVIALILCIMVAGVLAFGLVRVWLWLMGL